MQIRCPHCQNPIEVVEQDLAHDLTCPSCGSNFSLVGGDATTTHHRPTIRQVGHFELVEQIGMGAFGSVWKARDTELDRVVAVKIPRKEQLDPSEAEQFLREARAAAQLRHPHIVSVHEVGRDGDTIYMVSDLVRGVTLADWLSGQKPTPREAAEICAKVAEALHHAHEQGVIHRDMKPSNIMLDADGQPHLMDFGLAKREAGEITMTVDGHVLGTPAYMSPEQARGEGHTVDRRTDIYSLGAILFQMLTGELPFRGTPRMLLHQVLNEEPRSPRSLNDRIPRDLETICLKAMAKELERRYATAQELADDLERWLTGEPILARPVGRIERSWRWCRRNPVVAGLSTLVVLALVSGIGVSTYFAVEADARASEAVAERERAEEGFREARKTVDKYFTSVSESKLLNVPGLQPLRKELLESALEHYQKFIGRYGDNPKVQAEMASTYMRVGTITSEIASKEQSLAAYEKAIEIYDKLVRENPAVADYQDKLGRACLDRGLQQSNTGRPAEAEASYHRALEICEKLVRENATVANYQDVFARAYNGLGQVQRTSGHNADAEASFQRALELGEKLVRENPSVANYQVGVAIAYGGMGSVQIETGRIGEAEASYKKVSETFEALIREYPKVTNYQNGLAAAYTNLGSVQRETGRFGEAESSYRSAVETYDKLVRENPVVADYQDRLAIAYRSLGRVQDNTGRNGQAEASFKTSLAICETLARENPTVIGYQGGLADAYNVLGLLQTETGRNAEAEVRFKKAIEIYEKLVREDPTATGSEHALALAYNNLGIVQAGAAAWADAEASYRRAIEVHERMAREHPTVIEYRDRVAATMFGLSHVLIETNRRSEAEASLKTSIEIIETLVRENPTIAGFQSMLATAYNDLGTSQWNSSRRADVAVTFQRAIDIYEKLVRDGPTVADYQDGLALTYDNLGNVQNNTGRREEAEVSIKRAIELRERLVQENPTVVKYNVRLANAYGRLGFLKSNVGRNAEAEVSCNKSVALLEGLVRANPKVADYRAGLELAHALLIMVQTNAGKNAEAEDSCKRAVDFFEEVVRANPTIEKLKSQYAASLARFGDTLAMSTKWSESADVYAQAIEASGNYWETVFQCALLRLAAGDLDGYRAMSREFVAKNGDTSNATRLYAVALTCVIGAGGADSMEPVIELARRGIELDKQNPGMLVLLGAAQFRAGQLVEARGTLKKALPPHALAALAVPARTTEIRLSQLSCLTFLAMVQHALKDEGELRKTVEAAEKLISEMEKMKPPTDGSVAPWSLKLSVTLARRELDKLKAPATPEPATEGR